MIPTCAFLPGFDAGFSGGVSLEDVQGEVPEDPKVFSGVAYLDPALVFAEDNAC